MRENQSFIWGERALKSFIDRTTMYRLVLYYLLILFAAALLSSVVGTIPYAPTTLLWSLAVLLFVSWGTNTLFARFFRAVTNTESVYITAFILALIMSPVAFTDGAGSITLALVAVLAMASKYILAIGKKHIFNPAALAAALSAFVLGTPPSWWVTENLFLLILTLLGGLIVVYKLRKFDLIIAFSIAALVISALTSSVPLIEARALVLESAFLFFTFVMLTEPLTMPNTRLLRIAYGMLVGVLFTQVVHFGSWYFTPELALLVGNLFAYLVSPKGRYMLTFVNRHPLANGIYEYIFNSDRPLRFSSGQYLEWTLGNVPPDNRGNRRFFTIASAPEQTTLALGVRFYDKPSAFKRTLAELHAGAVVSAASLAGDFTMPKDTKRKLAFLAGGIGVTPFASMARHIIGAGEKRDAALLYSVKAEDEIAYREVFTEATGNGLRASYIVSDIINADRIKREIPDYATRLFYISGPPGFVDAMKANLLSLGLSRFNIKTDFFPGLA